MGDKTKITVIFIAVIGVYWLWEWRKEDIPEIIKKIVYWVCYLEAVCGFVICVFVNRVRILLSVLLLLFLWFISYEIIFGPSLIYIHSWKEYYEADGLWLLSLLVIALFLVEKIL